MLGERATLGLNFGKTALYTARFTGEKKKASRELKGIKDFLMAADVTDAKTNQVLADHLWLAIPIKKSRLIGKGDLFEFRAKVTMYMNKEEGGIKHGLKGLQEIKIREKCETSLSGSLSMNGEGAQS